MDIHPLAALIPKMSQEEYDTLRDDIAAHGLYEPIRTYEGQILDGRHRYYACVELDIEPRYEPFEGSDPIGYVASANLHRRHLTSSQRAVIALAFEAEYAKTAKEREYAGVKIDPGQSIAQGKSAEQAAQVADTNKQYVKDAKKLATTAPDLLEQVKDGELSIPEAKKVYQKRQHEDTHQAKVETAQTLPDTVFNVIYADPPWEYDNTGVHGAADHHYGTMPLHKICSFLDDIELQVADNAVLFLWVTNPFLQDAFDVLDAWNFEYKTNMVWVKTDLVKPGSGFYVRGRHELLFIATRGSFTPLDQHISPPIGSVLEAPLQEHSRKPESVYDIIERLYAGCNYVELFARQYRDRWVSYGNELS